MFDLTVLHATTSQTGIADLNLINVLVHVLVCILKYIYRVVVDFLPSFVAIWVAVKSNELINKRNIDANIIKLLEDENRLFNNLQIKLNELNLKEQEYLYIMSDERYEVILNMRAEVFSISGECKLMQYLQIQMYNNIKTFDEHSNVEKVCRDTLDIVIKAKKEIDINPALKNDLYLQPVCNEINVRFKALEDRIINNSDIVMNELKSYFSKKKRGSISDIFRSILVKRRCCSMKNSNLIDILEKLNTRVPIKYDFQEGQDTKEAEVDLQLIRAIDILGGTGSNAKSVEFFIDKVIKVIRQEIKDTSNIPHRLAVTSGIKINPEQIWDVLFALELVAFEYSNDNNVQKITLTSKGVEVYKNWKVDSKFSNRIE